MILKAALKRSSLVLVTAKTMLLIRYGGCIDILFRGCAAQPEFVTLLGCSVQHEDPSGLCIAVAVSNEVRERGHSETNGTQENHAINKTQRVNK